MKINGKIYRKTTTFVYESFAVGIHEFDIKEAIETYDLI